MDASDVETNLQEILNVIEDHLRIAVKSGDRVAAIRSAWIRWLTTATDEQVWNLHELITKNMGDDLLPPDTTPTT